MVKIKYKTEKDTRRCPPPSTIRVTKKMSKPLTEDTANVEKLADTENFQIWKFQVEIVLRAHELYEVVTEETAEVGRTAAWKKKDAQAQKIIVTTVDKKSMMHLLDCKTANEMWIKICTIYERDNEQQKCSLLQTFYSLTCDRNTDIASHISDLKNIATKLTAINTRIEDHMIVSKILATLPQEYKHFASAWDSTPKGEKTLENLTARLITEEMRLKDKKIK